MYYGRCVINKQNDNMIVYKWFCSITFSKGSLYGKCSEKSSTICGLENLADRERLASKLFTYQQTCWEIVSWNSLLRNGAYYIRNKPFSQGQEAF